jgi:putative transposase
MHRLGSALVLISSQERAELERLTRRHSAPRRTVQRAQIILLAAENQTVTSIATTLHLCANTVRKWIGRYTHKLPPTPPPENYHPQPAAPPPPLLRRLADAPRSGRPDTFTAQQTCALIALACEKP